MSNSNDSRILKAELSASTQTGSIPEIQDEVTGEFVVPVRNETPALGTAYAVTLSSNNQYRELVPRDPNRRNAFVLAVDNDVYICSSREVAAQVAGGASSTLAFYLPKSIAFPIDSKSPFWVACTTTSGNSRVSVMVSKDDA